MRKESEITPRFFTAQDGLMRALAVSHAKSVGILLVSDRVSVIIISVLFMRSFSFFINMSG